MSQRIIWVQVWSLVVSVSMLLVACAPAPAAQPTAAPPKPTARRPRRPRLPARQPRQRRSRRLHRRRPRQPRRRRGGRGARGRGRQTRLTITYPAEIGSSNPYNAITSSEPAVWGSILEPLVDWDEKSATKLRSVLAESWEIADPTTWIFHLRKNVKFHDGTPFTANDVVHSFNRAKTDKQSIRQGLLSGITKVEAVDDTTVKFSLKTPDTVLLTRLKNIFITSQAVYQKYGPDEADNHPIGTGPYSFKEWVKGQRVVMEKNPSYWGSTDGLADEAIYRGIKEAEPRLTALLNGEVDLIAEVSPDVLARVNSSEKAKAMGVRSQRLMYLIMNPAFKPWDNKTLRQAVSYAIDKKGLIDGLLGGHGFPLDAPVGDNVFGYSDSIQPRYEYSPAKAKQLLAQAGYPNGLEVDLFPTIGNNLKDYEIAQAMGQMLTNVGIRTSVKNVEWSTLLPQINETKVPFYFMGKGSVDDPSEYLHQLFRTGVTKRSAYSNPKVDELLLAEATGVRPGQAQGAARAGHVGHHGRRAGRLPVQLRGQLRRLEAARLDPPFGRADPGRGDQDSAIGRGVGRSDFVTPTENTIKTG